MSVAGPVFDKAGDLAIVSMRTEFSSLSSSASLELSSPSEPQQLTFDGINGLAALITLSLAVLLTERTSSMSAKLFVGNLSPETTTEDLRALFGQVGGVDTCQLIMGPDTGRSKGFGFIEMNSVESADAAKEKLNGQVLNGRTLKVDHATPKRVHRNLAGYSGSRRN